MKKTKFYLAQINSSFKSPSNNTIIDQIQSTPMPAPSTNTNMKSQKECYK